MYLINYDLYDLHAFFTFFRSAPARFPDYILPVKQLVEHVNAPVGNTSDFNAVRRIISPFYDPRDESLSWVLVNNMYTANVFAVKTEAYYHILSAVFKEMLDFYNDEQRLYLLCDAVHNIPVLLADEKKPKPIIAAMIGDYRKQYNRAFLENELKNVK